MGANVALASYLSNNVIREINKFLIMSDLVFNSSCQNDNLLANILAMRHGFSSCDVKGFLPAHLIAKCVCIIN